MKIRTVGFGKLTTSIALVCLIGTILLTAGYEHGNAQSNPAPASAFAETREGASLKIGVVSVMKVLRECKRSVQYRQDTMAEHSKVMAELEKLSKELDADEAGLKTLKPGSPDYLKQYKQILDKRSALQVGQEYHKQQRALKERQITEELYKEILQITTALAEQKGLDLVFERDEPELSASSGDELVLTISTHKLLYAGSFCADITGEVIARLDDSSGRSQP
ncbi:MAG: OmpH family outer membrane protein [Sedimentisphaerales bacterium]|jgi:Skp family chaperone for outer membrane proteins|nr:OmpH family outer membrane protein [Sedimentisphaerales bacterium]